MKYTKNELMKCFVKLHVKDTLYVIIHMDRMFFIHRDLVQKVSEALVNIKAYRSGGYDWGVLRNFKNPYNTNAPGVRCTYQVNISSTGAKQNNNKTDYARINFMIVLKNHVLEIILLRSLYIFKNDKTKRSHANRTLSRCSNHWYPSLGVVAYNGYTASAKINAVDFKIAEKIHLILQCKSGLDNIWADGQNCQNRPINGDQMAWGVYGDFSKTIKIMTVLLRL